MTSLWLQNPPAIPTDPWASDQHFDEVIVGGGLTGLVSAVLFARAGHRVAVVEARTVGAVTTGNSTAKVTQLQGTQLSKVRSFNLEGVLHAYADGNRDAFEWVDQYTQAHGVPVQRRDAVTYAATEAGSKSVDREYELARTVGLDVHRAESVDLPFPTYGAVVLPDQLQLDPLHLLAALAAELRSLGGVIHDGVRVRDFRASSPARVVTANGDLTAERVIIATGAPILDRGLYFAKVSAHRSYAQAFDVPDGTLPNGMFIGVEQPVRSIREASGLLLTGGNGHPVGREPSPLARADELTAWTQEHWPGATKVASWSAQDYSPAHHVPFVGWMPRGRGKIFLATGYDKWGMTNAVAAALTLAADILGDPSPWQKVLHRRVTTAQTFARGLGENAAVGWWYLKGYAAAYSRAVPDEAPAEGTAAVGRQGIRPVAVSTIDGVTCSLSAVCSHLGAAVTWNDAEKSWDCPAHGSRFASDGTLLEGPATRNLRRLG